MLDKVKEIALAIAAIGSLVLIFSVIGLIAMTIVVHYGSQLISYVFTGIEELTWFQSFIVALIIYFISGLMGRDR